MAEKRCSDSRRGRCRGGGSCRADEQAVERYRYLLRTAPPETIEAAHAEAFAKLTPEQRRMVLQELDDTLTPAERAAGVAYDEEPRSLARLATRAEMRQPGTLERTWSGMPAMGGVGMGGMFLNNFMGTIAGVMVGSMIADAFLGDSGYDQSAAASDADTAPTAAISPMPGSTKAAHSATSAAMSAGSGTSAAGISSERDQLSAKGNRLGACCCTSWPISYGG